MSSIEDRNFRYGYYEKVGFGGIEEKKSLEILLREKPIDLLSRLAQLASRYSLSAVQRKQVWQLLLNVIKPDNRISELQCQVRRIIIQDIMKALKLMNIIQSDCSDLDRIELAIEDNSRNIVLIYLFETRQLNSNIEKQLQKVEIHDLLMLAEVFIKEFVQPNCPYVFEDTYWIYKNFIVIINTNLGTLIETFEKFIQNLANEDSTLHNHLVKNGIIRQNNVLCQNSNSSIISVNKQNLILKQKIVSFRPIITWFVRFFAGIIHQNFVIRVLDKVIGCLINGSRPFYILISVSKALMLYLRKQLLLLNSAEQIQNQLLTPLSLEESEQIVFRALNY